jgi:Segregation and condensation complex subunit ScpB
MPPTGVCRCGLRLEVKPQFVDRIRRMVPACAAKPITSQALETLAIIALKQHVTIGDINAIAALRVQGMVQTLSNRKLIARAARRPWGHGGRSIGGPPRSSSIPSAYLILTSQAIYRIVIGSTRVTVVDLRTMYSSCFARLLGYGRGCRVLRDTKCRGGLCPGNTWRALRIWNLWFALEVIEQTIYYESLALVERDTGGGLPEACFREDGTESDLRPIDGATQATEEAFHPCRDVEVPF